MANKEQAGFVLYVDDWEGILSDYTADETQMLLAACITYFKTGKVVDLEDRALRSVFRILKRSIDRDRDAYTEKCNKNAWSRYVGTCKQKNIEPKTYEDWIDERQRTTTNVTNTNTSSSKNTRTNTSTSINTSLLTEEQRFENMRADALRRLQYEQITTA